MPVIGVTGGIASGKSTVTRSLVELLQRQTKGTAQAFSADEQAHWMLENDATVLQEVLGAFGHSVLGPDERIDREKLRDLVFGSPEKRTQLEAILHPRIRQAWTELATHFRLPENYLVAEIPLLYETNSERFLDCVVVVEADTRLQIERLSYKRGWSADTAQRVIEAQMPAEEKRRRAEILILNNHTEKLLADQIDLTTTALLTRYA